MADAILKFWDDLTGQQRLSVLVAGLLGLSALILLIVWTSRPDMQPVFSGLSGNDASAIGAKLKEEGIPYQLGAGGGTIEVSSGQVSEARVAAASAGLPKGGTVGFELFDKQNFAATDFSQRVNYQRALEGELTRTIVDLDEVAAARVHLVLAEDSIFVEDEKPATASVVIQQRAGSRLNPNQVEGIVRLVAGSVEALDPKNVTVTDFSGTILSQQSDGAGGATGRQGTKAKFERELEDQLQAMLTRAFGPNRAVTKVTAEMDFSRTEEKRETYQPADGTTGLVVAGQTSEESFSGSGTAPGGQAGTPSNLPPGASGSSDSGENTYSKKEESSQYVVNKTVQTVIAAPGKVTKLSVAVLVDGELESAEIARVERLVETAAGIDSERGDRVTVESVEFDKSFVKDEQKAMAAASRSELVGQIVKYVLLVAAVGVLVFLLRGRMKAGPESLPMSQASPALAGGALGGGGPAAAPAPEPRSNSASGLAAGDKDEIRTLIEDQPEEAAQLIRGWMAGG